LTSHKAPREPLPPRLPGPMAGASITGAARSAPVPLDDRVDELRITLGSWNDFSRCRA
jgi:hypothetical protein